MKIAIIGGGLAGLSLASSLPALDITLFDEGGPNASNMAAGLLHCYGGLHAKKSPFADEALSEALTLLGPNAVKTKILRPILVDHQMPSYKKTAENFSDVDWIENCQNIEPAVAKVPGILIDGYIVDTGAYLDDLKKRLHGKVHFIQKRCELNELQDFDCVIITAGAASQKLVPSLPLNAVKGRLMRVSWNLRLSIPVNSQVYAISKNNEAIIGSTYERVPSEESVQSLLDPKLRGMFPELTGYTVLETKEAFRSTTPDHLPLVQQIDSKTWVFAGLGSKGLLYHAYFAKKLALTLQGSL